MDLVRKVLDAPSYLVVVSQQPFPDYFSFERNFFLSNLDQALDLYPARISDGSPTFLTGIT
jgi:hypothetical protein